MHTSTCVTTCMRVSWRRIHDREYSIHTVDSLPLAYTQITNTSSKCMRS